jgi:hypothetical protein
MMAVMFLGEAVTNLGVAAAAFAAVLGLNGAARAEIVDAQPNGFLVQESALVQASPAKVWQVLLVPARWWSSPHTFSGDARNLHLDARVGGDWTETLPSGGGVRHMTVVFIDPPSLLRMEGALGPMQDFGAAGHLTIRLKAEAGGTRVDFAYDLGGHSPHGLDKIAPAVDHVLGEQITGLKAAAEASAKL